MRNGRRHPKNNNLVWCVKENRWVNKLRLKQILESERLKKKRGKKK